LLFPVFLVIGTIFIAVGIALTIASNSVVESSKRYDAVCDGDKKCNVTLEVDEKMEKPVYLYYQLENFYQNHRRYVKSRNDDQLRGLKVTKYADLVDCDPRKSEGDPKKPKEFLTLVVSSLGVFSMIHSLFTIREKLSL